jgi:hypothetical protein
MMVKKPKREIEGGEGKQNIVIGYHTVKHVS